MKKAKQKSKAIWPALRWIGLFLIFFLIWFFYWLFKKEKAAAVAKQAALPIVGNGNSLLTTANGNSGGGTNSNPNAPSAPVATLGAGSQGQGNNSSLTINWAYAGATPTKFNLLRADATGPYANAFGWVSSDISANARSFTTTGLNEGVAHRFKILATNANGSTESAIIDMPANYLSTTGGGGGGGGVNPPPVSTGQHLNNAAWTAPAQSAAATLKLIGCEPSPVLNATLSATSNPNLWKITPQLQGTYDVSQLILNGRLIANAPFFVALDEEHQLCRRAMNGATSFDFWWDISKPHIHEVLEFVVTKRA